MRHLGTTLLVVALAGSPALAQNGKGSGKSGTIGNNGTAKVDQNVGTNGNGQGYGTANKGKGSNSGPGKSATVTGGLFGLPAKATLTSTTSGTVVARASLGPLSASITLTGLGTRSSSATGTTPGSGMTPVGTAGKTPPANTVPQPVAASQPPVPGQSASSSLVASNGIDPQDPPSGPAPDPIPPPEVAFAEPEEVDEPISPPEFIDLLFNQPKDIRLQLTVPRYGYFKGLVYSKQLVRMIGQIRVIGGVVAAGENSAVALSQGAMATSNPDAFNNRVKAPVQRMRIVEWKEVGN